MAPALYTCAHTPLNILRLGSLLTPRLHDPGGHSLESWGEGTHRGSGLESGAFGCLAGAALESVVLRSRALLSSVLFPGPTPSLHLGSGSLFSASQAAAFIWLAGWGWVGGGRERLCSEY